MLGVSPVFFDMIGANAKTSLKRSKHIGDLSYEFCRLIPPQARVCYRAAEDAAGNRRIAVLEITLDHQAFYKRFKQSVLSAKLYDIQSVIGLFKAIFARV